jgi:hypothetical protein
MLWRLKFYAPFILAAALTLFMHEAPSIMIALDDPTVALPDSARVVSINGEQVR